MWASQKKLAARGVKFYFIIKQDIPEKERTLWEDAIKRSSPLSKCFRVASFGYSDHPALISEWQGWNLVKVFCSDAQISVKPSEVKSSYNKIFLQFSEWFIKFSRTRKVECKPYDFRILFRLHPPEDTGEFVPIPSMGDVAKKVVSPPILLPSPPATRDEMFNLAKKTTPVSGQAFEITLQYAEKEKMKVYGSYGVRTEEDANTYELDIVMPNLSEEVESMRDLPGELCYQLILQSLGKVTPDFDTIVRALLARLLLTGLMDQEKIEHIAKNAGDYFETTQWRTRFILKFDLKKMDLTGERSMALDSAKKDIKRQLKDTPYSLFGVVSYELTNEDLTRIEAVIDNINYFKNAKRDELFMNLSIILVDRTYERMVEIARRTDEILNSHKIIDLDKSPGMATDIEDAKKRWSSAVSDCVRDGREVASFMFFKEIIAVPLQVFTSVSESIRERFHKIASETTISATLTSDNQPSNVRYGCYVTSAAP